MNKKSKLELSLLRAAYLNDNPFAVFEALNIVMDYRPYGIDDDSNSVVDEVPVWLLQALRETAVYRLDNPKKLMTNNNGKLQAQSGKNNDEKSKTKKHQNEFHCHLAVTQAAGEGNKYGKRLKGDEKLERAKQILEGNNLNLSINAIKKYSERFAREDKKLMNLGNYFFMTEKDKAIYDAVIHYNDGEK